MVGNGVREEERRKGGNGRKEVAEVMDYQLSREVKMPTHQCFVTNMSWQGYEFTIHKLEGRGDWTASYVSRGYLQSSGRSSADIVLPLAQAGVCLPR